MKKHNTDQSTSIETIPVAEETTSDHSHDESDIETVIDGSLTGVDKLKKGSPKKGTPKNGTGSGNGKMMSKLTSKNSKTQTYPISELLDEIPTINSKGYKALKADIVKNGLQRKILMYRGEVIDGRARLRVCSENNIEPVFEIIEDEIPNLKEFIESLHMHHKDYSPSQRGLNARLDIKSFENALALKDKRDRKNKQKKKNEDPTGAARLACQYHCVSYGYYVLADKLLSKENHELAVKLVLEDKISLETANMLAGKPDLEVVCNFLDGLDIDGKLAPRIIAVKNTDPELFSDILTRNTEVEIKEDLSIYSFNKHDNIYQKLRNGQIDLSEARNSVKELKKQEVVPEPNKPETQLDIKDNTRKKLLNMASMENISVEEFINKLLKGYKPKGVK